MSGEVLAATQSLGDLVEILSGFPFKSDAFSTNPDEGTPLIRIRDIKTHTPSCSLIGDYDAAYLIGEGDIIIGMDGEFTAVRWQGVPALLNQRVLKIRSSQPDLLDEDYLFYRIQSDLAHLETVISGTTVKHLSVKDIRRLEWHLPPLDEQRRIAEVLRSVDDALSLVEQQARQAEMALSAYSAGAFAGAVLNDDGGIALEDLLSHVIDYRGVPPPKSAAGVPLLTAKNVRFGYLDPEPREFIAEEDYDSWMRRGLPTAGDVMFTTEAPLGNVANFPNYRAALGQRTLTLRPKRDRLTSDYLKWLLLSPNAQDLIQRHATGSTAKGIKQSTFRKLRFNVPTLDEQVAVGVACEAVWAIVVEARDQISIMRDMRSMLSKDLLSGRVRVPA